MVDLGVTKIWPAVIFKLFFIGPRGYANSLDNDFAHESGTDFLSRREVVVRPGE